jgi:hypothetical protein
MEMHNRELSRRRSTMLRISILILSRWILRACSDNFNERSLVKVTRLQNFSDSANKGDFVRPQRKLVTIVVLSLLMDPYLSPAVFFSGLRDI